MEKDPQTYVVIGAAMEVHKTLGRGFLENVYQEALALEFDAQGVPFEKEVRLDIHYKDRKLETFYRADFVCFHSIIVETKALDMLSSKEESQLLNYLKATGIKRGLLLNFGARKLEYRRFVF